MAEDAMTLLAYRMTMVDLLEFTEHHLVESMFADTDFLQGAHLRFASRGLRLALELFLKHMESEICANTK